MTILHIAFLRNDPFTGVCVAAPEHVRNQGKFAEVALLNTNDCHIEGIENQFVYHNKNWKNDVSLEFQKPDIAIFHEVYHLEFARIARDLDHDGIPYVIIPHGCLVRAAQQKKWWKKTIANMLFFYRFIHHSLALQCLSINEMNNTAFNVPKFIGTNGVNVTSKYKSSFNKNKIKIIYIGRLEIIPKGIDLLLKAVWQVKQDANIVNEFTIDMFGPDVKGRYAEVEQLINTNEVGDVVTLHHELLGEEKQNRLLHADVFIQTSRHEGMPMGILEALSFSLPCLITEGTSLGDIVKKYDAGWVAQNSVDSIAKTLVTALRESDEYLNKSTNARRLIDEHFSWEVIAKAAVAKYRELLDK